MATSLKAIHVAGLTAFLGACVLASSMPIVESDSGPFERDLLEDRAALDLELKSSPSPSQLWIERAEIQGELKMWSGALEDLGRALGAGADPYRVEYEKGKIYGAMGEHGLSADAASRALELRPDSVEARVLRGKAAAAGGLFVEAADDFGQALALVPKRPLDLVYAHAEALAKSESGARAALEALEEEMAVRGELPSLMLRALDHERELGQHGAALRRLDRLVEGGWSSARALQVRGDVLFDQGDPSGAKLAWRSALAALDELPNRRRTTRASLRLRTAIQKRIQGDS